MLRSVAAAGPDVGARLRLYAPDDALLFSNLDARRPGYARAVEIARAAGFEPVIRLAGGHAAVFLRESVAFAWATPDPDAHLHIRPRFERLTGWVVAALERLGLDARVGELAGEYCPGEFSVNIAGRAKVMGVGQRVIRGAAHTGGVITVGRTDALREILVPIYEALELELRPELAAGVADFAPGIGPEDVIAAFAEAVAADGASLDLDLDEADLEPPILAAAEALAAHHDAAGRAAGAREGGPSAGLRLADAKTLLQGDSGD